MWRKKIFPQKKNNYSFTIPVFIKNFKQIFLADDDEDDQLFFVNAMEEINPAFDCQIARNGEMALKLLKNAADIPAIIFLDINMPIINGMDCLKALRADARFDPVPIIMLTTSSGEATRAHHYGANLFLTKPPSFTELLQMLRRVIGDHIPS